ncbi:MAG: response regulator transcription factor [Opitutae bacterium]|nr:response regulator transcription factor [Opitutae bacterium]
MVTNKLQALAKYQRMVARLEKQLQGSQRKLCALPAKFGCKSMDEFIKALRAADRGGPAPRAHQSGGSRRKRAVITPEMKQKLKGLAQAGKTGGEIAKALGISLPSVHNIKKELGLVKKRG